MQDPPHLSTTTCRGITCTYEALGSSSSTSVGCGSQPISSGRILTCCSAVHSAPAGFASPAPSSVDRISVAEQRGRKAATSDASSSMMKVPSDDATPRFKQGFYLGAEGEGRNSRVLEGGLGTPDSLVSMNVPAVLVPSRTFLVMVVVWR